MTLSILPGFPRQEIGVKRVEGKSPGKTVSKASPEIREAAARLARQLNEQNRSLRFIVRDPNSAKVNNVIIEVRHGEKVVATIPSEEITRLAEAMETIHPEEAMKGLIIDERVS